MAETMTTRLLDRPTRYGPVSRCFHWIMACLLLWQFLVALCWILLGKGAVTEALQHLGPSHGAVGVLVFLLVLPRIAWTVANRRRRPPADPAWPGRMARIVHRLFYLLMLVVPALALIRAYGSGKGYAALGQQIIPATGTPLPWLEWPADLLHSPLAWIFAVLIAGHGAMALLHAIVLRDGTLRRMAGRPSAGTALPSSR